MKICTLHGVTLRVHPLFLLILLLYTLAGQGIMIAACVLALALHEAGHYAAACHLRLPVSEIELTPFGGAMQIAGSDGATGRSGFLLAAAGPLVNAICLAASYFVLQRSAMPFMVWFALSNLSMLAANLLPILPLDGGRMVLALLSPRFGRPHVFRALLLLGRIAAAALIACSLALALKGLFRPAWMALGCYLFYAASLEEKHGTARFLSALFSRRLRAENGAALPVQHLCVSGGTALYTLLPQLRPAAYHLVSVVDDQGCKILGTVDEAGLYNAVLHAPHAAMAQIIADYAQK